MRTCCMKFIVAASLALTVTLSAKTKIACIGDSITFGSGVAAREKLNYPSQLGYLLGDEYEVKNFGVSGRTMLNKGNAPYTKEKAYKDSLSFEPNIVIIKLGTNDSKPPNWKFKAEFQQDTSALIESYRSLPSKPRIILCQPVPVVKTRWGISEKVTRGEVAPAIRDVALANKVELFDFHPVLANHLQDLPDGVHPNAFGAEKMARAMYRFLTAYEHLDKPYNPAAHAAPSSEFRGGPAGWGGGTWFDQHEKINKLTKENQDLELVFLGDSITQSWTGSKHRLANKNGKRPFDQAFGKKWKTASFGISGDRTDQLLYRIKHGNFDGLNPKAVVLMIGVNNILKSNHTADQITGGINAVVEALNAKLPKTEVILLGPFPAGEASNDPRRKTIAQVQKQIAPLGEREHVTYLDLSSKFMHSNGLLNKQYYSGDFIHLKRPGYQAWAEALLPALEKVMQ